MMTNAMANRELTILPGRIALVTYGRLGHAVDLEGA